MLGPHETSKADITQLLRAWGSGDESALEKLMPLVYDELHRMAEWQMARERPDHTLQATALVHESFLRLIEARRVNWQNRAHFLALAAQMMRRILTDMARSRHRLKHGSVLQQVSLESADEVAAGAGKSVRDKLEANIDTLNEALDRLACLDPRKAKIVELRFYGGLTIEEAAAVVKVSPRTVKLDWNFAKAWLHRELSKGAPHGT